MILEGDALESNLALKHKTLSHNTKILGHDT